jgi:DNA polymerase V
MTIIVAPSRYSDFTIRKSSASHDFEIPTASTVELLKQSKSLFDTFYDPEVPYKKAGVILEGILPIAHSSQSLFGDTKESHGDVYAVVDSLNEKFGSGTVTPGTVFNLGKWQEHKKLKSPERTTKWSEIAHVKAI